MPISSVTLYVQVLEQLQHERRSCLNHRDHNHIRSRVAFECRNWRVGGLPQTRAQCQTSANLVTNKREAPEVLASSDGMLPPRPSSRQRVNDQQSQMRQLNVAISRASTTDELLHLAICNSGSLNHIHIANLWNKLGKQPNTSEARHGEQVQHVLRCTIPLVDSCDARALSNISHGLSKCRLENQETGELYAAVAAKAVRSGLDGFNAQNMANTVWAYAMAQVPAAELYAVVAAKAVSSGLEGFNAQGMANTVWAYAKAQVPADELYAVVAAKAVSSGLEGFNAQDMTNTVWAYATAEMPADELYAVVAAKAVSSGLKGFNAQDMANTVWAYAIAGVVANDLVVLIADALCSTSLNQIDVAQIAYAFRIMCEPCTALPVLEHTARAAAALNWQFFERSLANLTATLLKAGLIHNELFSAIQASRSPALGHQDSNWLWIGKSDRSPLAIAIYDAIASSSDADSAIKILDPPLPGVTEEPVVEDDKHLTLRRSSRMKVAYHCVENSAIGKYGERRCPTICRLYYRIRGGLYCTWCMKRGGWEGSAEAVPMTMAAYHRAWEGCSPSAQRLLGKQQQAAVLLGVTQDWLPNVHQPETEMVSLEACTVASDETTNFDAGDSSSVSDRERMVSTEEGKRGKMVASAEMSCEEGGSDAEDSAALTDMIAAPQGGGEGGGEGDGEGGSEAQGDSSGGAGCSEDGGGEGRGEGCGDVVAGEGGGERRQDGRDNSLIEDRRSSRRRNSTCRYIPGQAPSSGFQCCLQSVGSSSPSTLGGIVAEHSLSSSHCDGASVEPTSTDNAPATVTADELPASWQRVPSSSRPGEFSYLHVPTGLKQKVRPDGEPSSKVTSSGSPLPSHMTSLLTSHSLLPAYLLLLTSQAISKQLAELRKRKQGASYERRR